MCGYDPCTCGKPDAWGHCACGGFEDTSPTVTIDIEDQNVVRVVSAFGRTWLLPVAPGSTTVTVSAELIHYQSASYSFAVEVEPFGLVDMLLISAAFVLVVGLLMGVSALLRFTVRFVRRRLAVRAQWRARGKQLREEFPLTWQAKLKTERYASANARVSADVGADAEAGTGEGACADANASVGANSKAGTGVKAGAISRWRRPRNKARRPFLHDFLFSLRQAAPVFLAGIIAFAVLVPVSTSMVTDVSVFNVDYTHEQLKYQLYAQDLSWVVNAACVLFGAVLAVSLFRFLLMKRATTAFFSVGLSRVKLFLARFGAGLACIVVGIGVPFAVSLLLNHMALGLYEGQLAEFAYVSCGYITVALVAFALASIAVICAGTLFETCAFAVALLGGVSALLWGIGVLADYLLVGNAAGSVLYGQSVEVAPSFLDSLSYLNPVLFFAEAGAEHQYFMALHPVYYPEGGSWLLIEGWLLGFVALSVIALFALCRRRGEQAEMAGKATVFSLCSVAVFGHAAFAAAVAVLGSVDIAVALVVGAALFILVSLVCLFGPLRGRTSQRMTLACVTGELVCMALVVGTVYTGVFGYASYIPNTADVESVEVSYNGSPSYLTEGFSGVSSGASYYYTSYRTYTDEASVDIVRSIHSQLISTARQTRETYYTDFESTVVPYDVVIRYTLTDGSVVVRYYNQASIGELSSMLSLDNDEHTSVIETAAITGDTSALTEDEATALSESPSYSAYQAGYIYLADAALNRILAVECTDEQRAALQNALATDLANLTAAQRYASEERTRAVLMFTLSPELDVSSFGYSFSNAVSYITDEWTETMAWLDETGYLDSLGRELDASVIEQLTFQLDDPYASINKVTSPLSRYFMAYRSEVSGQFWITQDYGSLTVIEDSEQIAEIVPNLRLGCYMTGGYLVQAKLRGIEAYVYFYLPSSAVPSYL